MNKLLPILLAAPMLAAGVMVAQTFAQSPAAYAADKAPEFALKSADTGKVQKLSDLKGKVVLVDFWATWCPPCRAEIPDFISLQNQYGAKGLQVVGVSVDKGGTPGVVKFMKENKINYPILMSDPGTESAYGGIRAIPTTFLLDRQGNIVKKYIGGRSREDFEKDLKVLL